MVARKKAFTLVELILILLLLGVVSAICIPRFNFAVVSNQNAECLVSKIVTDLRRTRTLAMSNCRKQYSRLCTKYSRFSRQFLL